MQFIEIANNTNYGIIDIASNGVIKLFSKICKMNEALNRFDYLHYNL